MPFSSRNTGDILALGIRRCGILDRNHLNEHGLITAIVGCCIGIVNGIIPGAINRG